MNDAFINSYFHGGSSVFKDGYRITEMQGELTGYLDTLSIKDKVGAQEFIRNLLVSIFIHNTTYIKTTDLFLLFKYLSVESTLRLIQSNSIRLIDDNGLDTGLLIDSAEKKYIGFFENSYMYPDHKKAEHFDSSFKYLEFQLSKSPVPSNLKASLLINVEKRSIILKNTELIEKIKKELDYDFQNKNVTESLGVSRSSIEDMSTENTDKVLRLVKSNQALIYSRLLNVDNLICEANSLNDYHYKFTDLYSINRNKSVESYNYLANKFGVPDFTDLILNDIISIDEFLELRTKRGASKFRDWFSHLEHDKEKALEDLLLQSTSIKNDNKILKFIRWAFSNAIGVIEPISGTIYSAVDTYLVDKLATGWMPNIYFNKCLANYLNKKVELKWQDAKENQLEKYFGKVGRNEKCPCESGKKYKHCCGK